MHANMPGNLIALRRARGSALLPRIVLGSLPLIALLPVSGTTLAQQAAQAPLGIAWEVRGQWHVAGSNASLLSGDAIPPAALLQPGDEAGSHAIHIFLPDGQRIFYECFAPADCAHGFRVPPLYRRPDPFAVEMLARIRAACAHDNYSPAARGEVRPLPRDEVVAVIGAGSRVQVAGLAADLPNGRYTYDLLPVDRIVPAEFHRALEKGGRSLMLALPGAGLYDLRITDDRNVPRIDLFVAAIRAADSVSIAGPFQRASALLGDWNIDYQGWPIHEFQWAYLESLVLNIRPQRAAAPVAVALAGASSSALEVTAEPAFSPRPGVFLGDTAVTLRCATPGATMHFTVDNSQPLDRSPVYTAPIMVKGTELTVKAYASAQGKKDSAVVTGIFRIQDQDQ